ncbi:MAG: hypothetical protein Q7S32_02240 [bacterium]|nr:hypothetical protein [bacterium]
MNPVDFSFIFQTTGFGLDVLFSLWWIYVPIILFVSFIAAWQHYIHEKYLESLEWTTLQIKPPPTLDRTLKAVEQIFAGIHGIYIGPVNWKDRLLRGKVQDWFSLEIVGIDGVTNFYIRTLAQYQGIVESNVFAQYPDAEIVVAEDYIRKWPQRLPNAEMDLFGMELLLAKESAYPIQTYLYFEEKPGGPDNLKSIDPLSSVSEVFSTFRPGENFVIQILMRPTGDGWSKEGQTIIDKMSGKEPKSKPDALENIFKSIDGLFLGGSAEKEDAPKDKKLSSREEDIAKAIGKKVAKLGFETSIRLSYIAKKEVFHRHHFAGIMGALKQLSTLNLNSFKPNSATVTYSKGMFYKLFPSDKGFFAEQRTLERKLRLYKDLRERTFPQKFFIFNTEEMATIYHLPGIEVRAPLFPRVQAKKGQPPAGLPLE